MTIEDYIKEFEPTIKKLCWKYVFMKDYSFEDLHQEAIIVLCENFDKINDQKFTLRQCQKYYSLLLLGRFHNMYVDYIHFHNMTGLIENHKEAHREYSRKYYEKNKETKQNYYETHKEQYKERWTKYYEENKKELNKKRNERRKKQIQNMKDLIEEQRLEIEKLRKEIEELKKQGA